MWLSTYPTSWLVNKSGYPAILRAGLPASVVTIFPDYHDSALCE